MSQTEPDKLDSLISEWLYEWKYFLNKDTNRRNRVLICKYNNWNKEFSKAWGLKEHYRVHTKERPFAWDKWGTRFTQKGSLLKHIKKNKTRGTNWTN